MGNASSHHKAGGVAEKAPGGDLGKNGGEYEEKEQIRKRSSVGVESDREAIPLVCPEPLSERQKELLVETWKELEQNIAQVGVITFISLFETHPDVQQVFMPFKEIELEELKHSKQLRAHALRVMAFVQKAVARLHEPEKLEKLLQDLGKKHYAYGAKQKYVDLIGPQFIQAIQPSLAEQWTPDLNTAWVQLFQYMAFVMKTSMNEEEQRVRAQQ